MCKGCLEVSGVCIGPGVINVFVFWLGGGVEKNKISGETLGGGVVKIVLS